MATPPPLVWFVTLALVLGAMIDGWKLKVPNWLTFPLAFAGLVYSSWAGGWNGLAWSLAGLASGMLLVLVYACGWVGAGDVKLLAAAGTWVGASITFQILVFSIVFGGVIALAMMICSGRIGEHFRLMKQIFSEAIILRDPVKLSEIAASRKPRMMLLPYAIPIALGAIGFFLVQGMYV